jgi:hypothetical protein
MAQTTGQVNQHSTDPLRGSTACRITHDKWPFVMGTLHFQSHVTLFPS